LTMLFPKKNGDIDFSSHQVYQMDRLFTIKENSLYRAGSQNGRILL
jgi:hypothetical protein